ncbi:hypothetical protein [Streptomyces sp. RPT161]|uniref:hypothetical protein n=1 Tax=Streptomyces sp. RPT161 TaxID=3015993 RepID=UPI0022B92DB1|nr:hypothetical protein [Streptomyces sp. RPT161]
MSAQPVDLAQRIGAFITGFPVTGGYRVPDRAEREALAAGVLEVLDGRPDAARGRLATIGYTLRTLRRAGGDLAELCEPSWTGRGWGRVYVDVTRPARWSVQAPHPRSDLRTGRLAAEVFDRAPGGVLVLAGALRTAGEGDCADVAHRADSAFNAVCEALVARGLPAIQVHGFADASAPGHDVVVSPGPAPPGDAVRKAARLLDGQGFRVCRVWKERCDGLEGTTNVQARRAAAHGVPFVHVESSFTVRHDPAARARIADALAEVARGWLRPYS